MEGEACGQGCIRTGRRHVPRRRATNLGEERPNFDGSDGDRFSLVQNEVRGRQPWTGTDVSGEVGILGFRGARFRLRDAGATGELLTYMGYQKTETEGGITRYLVEGGNAADTIDLEELPDAPAAGQGAGSVHHIAFAVEDRAAQLKVREALKDTGYQVTPVIDRQYFYATAYLLESAELFCVFERSMFPQRSCTARMCR